MRTILPVGAVALLVAVPAHARQLPDPPAPATADPDTAKVNDAAGSAASAQTSAIRRAQDGYARDLAAYAAAQAAFERAKAVNDAERAAAAAQAADYQRNLRAWTDTVARMAASPRRTEKPPAAVAANQPPEPGRRICTIEAQTGSRLNRRRMCRTAAEARAAQAETTHEMESMGRTYRPATGPDVRRGN